MGRADNEGQTKKDRPGRGKAWGITLLALVDDFIIIAIVIILLRVFDVDLPVWALVLLGIIGVAIIVIVHRAVLNSFRKHRVTGREGMMGQKAVVVSRLQPKGTVQVGAEYWNAVSGEGAIEEGEEAVITGMRGLNLEVRKKV